MHATSDDRTISTDSAMIAGAAAQPNAQQHGSKKLRQQVTDCISHRNDPDNFLFSPRELEAC
jgi:hypothetical protein